MLPEPEPSSSRSHDPDFQDLLCSASEIQRPRSALHSGNFSEGLHQAPRPPQENEQIPVSTSHDFPLDFNVPSSASDWSSSLFHAFSRDAEATVDLRERRPWRSPAPSLASYSTAYVLKAPTTPLVQQSSITDLEPSSPSSSHGRSSPDKSKKRHTLPPYALQAKAASDIDRVAGSYNRRGENHPIPRAVSGPSYSHQARRSLSSAWSPQSLSPMQTPEFHKRRRQSFGSDTFPLQRASMVGSYEESIIHGWMSTPPSKPLDFTAKIGALGKGECKPKFPPHIMVPFPAVFYSWGNDFVSGMDADNEPSPYVGTIDLQNQRPVRDRDDPSTIGADRRQPNEVPASKRKRRSTDSSGFDPPPGNYRIPEQGQLQIVIQNPNKTAVKLFIVSYNLSGMEPRTKTFIRQRSSSTVGIDALAQNQSSQSDQRGKQKLRYMVHLNICCTTRGRFYLYHQIRVVFANRVPDNKEQLQCETLVPSPKFTPYHPPRRSAPTSTIGTPLSRPTVPSPSGGVSAFSPLCNTEHGALPLRMGTPPPPVPAIPFSLAAMRLKEENYCKQGPCASHLDGTDRAYPGQRPSVELMYPDERADTPIAKHNHSSEMLWTPWTSNTAESGNDNGKNARTLERLGRDDQQCGSSHGRPSTPQVGQGILAKNLKGINVPKGIDMGYGSGNRL